MRWQSSKGNIELNSTKNSEVDSNEISKKLDSALKLYETGNLQEAQVIYLSILQRKPHHSDALNSLGIIAYQTGEYDKAINLIERAINSSPNTPAYYSNCGNIYRAIEKYDSAVTYYKQALKLKPDLAEAHYNLGNCYDCMRQLEKAIFHFNHAILLNPDFVGAHNNLGKALIEKNEIDSAIIHLERALALDHTYAKTHNNLGIAHYTQDHYKQAISFYDNAIRLDPNYADAHVNLAIAYLLYGNFEEGWKEYKWRWQSKDFPSEKRLFKQPLWDGSSLTERIILIWGEQGIGDEIMFSSLLHAIGNCSSHCILECDARLAPLFSRSFPDIEVIPKSDPPNPLLNSQDIDFQSPIASAAQWLLPTINNFSPQSCYIYADETLKNICRKKYSKSGNKFIVGISWHSGNIKYGPSRSIPLGLWDVILKIPDIQFVNLQYGDHKSELSKINQALPLPIYHDEKIDAINNLDSFAAQVASVDLAISIDNSTVHMAGALGIPVWTLLPYIPDWRWLLDRSDSLWYPSMRLFRQKEPEKWQGVFDEVKIELNKLINN